MKTYQVSIAGTLVRQVKIKAKSAEAARDRAYYDWTDEWRPVHSDNEWVNSDGDDWYTYSPKEEWTVKEVKDDACTD